MGKSGRIIIKGTILLNGEAVLSWNLLPLPFASMTNLNLAWLREFVVCQNYP